MISGRMVLLLALVWTCVSLSPGGAHATVWFLQDYGTPPSPLPPHTNVYRVCWDTVEQWAPQAGVSGVVVYARDEDDNVYGPWVSCSGAICLTIGNAEDQYWDFLFIGCDPPGQVLVENVWVEENAYMGKVVVCTQAPSQLYEEMPEPEWP